MRPFFWLHIRKAGGTSLMKLFGNHYKGPDWPEPTPYVTLDRSRWNANLNDHRLPLGQYEYKRMLFAKKFLYPDNEFQQMYKFAVVRNPYERCVSCWKYLTKSWKYGKPRHMLAHRSFEYFLSLLPEIWEEKWDRHVSTHTAPIWQDVTDESGNLLADDLYRLETLEDEIPALCEKLEIENPGLEKRNQSGIKNYRSHYSKRVLRRIESLYGEDIERLEYRPF